MKVEIMIGVFQIRSGKDSIDVHDEPQEPPEPQKQSNWVILPNGILQFFMLTFHIKIQTQTKKSIIKFQTHLFQRNDFIIEDDDVYNGEKHFIFSGNQLKKTDKTAYNNVIAAILAWR